MISQNPGKRRAIWERNEQVMHPIVTFNRLVYGGLGLVFSLIFFALLAAAAAAAPIDDTLPADFSLPVGHHALFRAPASGDETYQCVATGGGYAWQLKGVDAKLLDSDGHVFATQSDVSSWLAVDGSQISGRVTKAVETPTGAYGDALYTITSNSSGGVLGQISDVVRDHVTGGRPPARACDQNALRQSVHVPFTADYIFFQAES
jgi:hypothetical protein